MPLSPLQQHAVAMLALGHATSTVARDLDICRQTLCRWKRQPEFQRALDRELGEMMAALNTQVQSTARVLVEGGLESAQQLRHMLVKPDTKDQDRRISATQLLKFAQRFWDLLGYNVALPKPRQLCSENLDAVQDAEPIPDVLPEPTEPGDRHLRAESERDPVGPETHAGGEPDWCTEWRFSPINDDGTPKHPPEAEIPGAEPREDSYETGKAGSDRDEPTEPDGESVVTVPASFVVRECATGGLSAAPASAPSRTDVGRPIHAEFEAHSRNHAANQPALLRNTHPFAPLGRRPSERSETGMRGRRVAFVIGPPSAQRWVGERSEQEASS